MSCLPIFVLLTGCSCFQQTSHIIEPEAELQPILAHNATASADTVEFTPQAFSLVAADSLGLATFGYELVLWDAMFTDLAYVE